MMAMSGDVCSGKVVRSTMALLLFVLLCGLLVVLLMEQELDFGSSVLTAPLMISSRRSLRSAATEKKAYTYVDKTYLDRRAHHQQVAKLHLDARNQEYYHVMHIQQQKWYETPHNYTAQDLQGLMAQASARFAAIMSDKVHIFSNQATWSPLHQDYKYTQTQCIQRICGNVQFRTTTPSTATVVKADAAEKLGNSSSSTSGSIISFTELRDYLKQPSTPSDHQVTERKVKIAVFSVWIVDAQQPRNNHTTSSHNNNNRHQNSSSSSYSEDGEPSASYPHDFAQQNMSQLNHQQYCRYHGYDYIHARMTSQEYLRIMATTEENTLFGDTFHLPYGWASVFLAKELLSTNVSSYDYFVKLDMDCLFANLDVRIEELIDPQERYSVYTSHTLKHSRFTQSHMYILRNDDLAKTFIQQWWSYRYEGFCNDIAQEQGAFHFTLGKTLYNHALRNAKTLLPAAFTCDQHCYAKHRSAFHHHHCVLDWYDDNHHILPSNGRMDVAGLYVYPKLSDQHLVSPLEGMSLEIQPGSAAAMSGLYRKTALLQRSAFDLGYSEGDNMKEESVFQPFTVHPCKHNPYLAPKLLMQHIDKC